MTHTHQIIIKEGSVTVHDFTFDPSDQVQLHNVMVNHVNNSLMKNQSITIKPVPAADPSIVKYYVHLSNGDFLGEIWSKPLHARNRALDKFGGQIGNDNFEVSRSKDK